MNDSKDQFTFAELEVSPDSPSGKNDSRTPSIRSTDGVVILSKVMLFILCLAAVALAAVVGVIVHFAQPGCSENCPPVIPCATTTAGPPFPPDDDLLWEMCINASIARNECLPTEPCLGTQPPGEIDYRLPRTLKPIHYSLKITPDIYHGDPDNFTFEGSVDIYLRCDEPTDVIVLHRRQLTVIHSSVTIKNEDSGDLLQWIQISEDYEREFMKIHLKQPLSINVNIIVSMEFFDKMYSEYGSGIFWTHYLSEGETKYMTYTQMEPCDLRRIFPCLDEPNLKATFNFTIQRMDGFEALANTPLVHSTPVDSRSDWFEDVFETTPVVMSPYLVAFTVADYGHVKDEANGGLTNKSLRYYGTHEDVDKGNLNYTVSVGGPMFDFFEEYFDYPYEFPKEDMIYVPWFSSGAMENWGLITYRWERFVYDPEYSVTEQRQQQANTIAHELLHMWLGNVVTCDWWDDLWLQEGFARYYQHVAVQHVHPEWDLEQLLVLQRVQSVLQSDSYRDGQAIYCPVGSAEEADLMFSTYTYDKGGSVIRMMASVIGSDTFQIVMQNWVEKLAYKTSTHDQLFAITDETLSDHSVDLGYNVTEAWRGWIKQNGYPVVTFNRNPDRSTEVKVSQKQFLVNPLIPDRDVGCTSDEYDHSWEVPLTYTTSKNADFQNLKHTWFSDQQGTLNLDDELGGEDWIIANLRQVGFYRVNYDEDNWDALIKQLNTKHTDIHVINRAQLIDDTSALSRAGEIDHLVALQMLEYLEKEVEYGPFHALQQNLGYLRDMLYETSAFPDLHMFILNLINDNYERLGWEENSDESLFDNYLRTTILRLACDYGLEDCREEARSRFELWRLDPENPTIIRPDIREFVFCHGAKYGTDKEKRWEDVFKQYQNETVEVERTRLRAALVCTEEPYILERLWQMTLTDGEGVLRSDRAAIQSAIANTHLVDEFVLGQLETNWDNLAAPRSLFTIYVMRGKSQDDLDRLQALLDRNGQNILFETWHIKNNIQWLERNLDDVTDWLKDAVDRQTQHGSKH